MWQIYSGISFRLVQCDIDGLTCSKQMSNIVLMEQNTAGIIVQAFTNVKFLSILNAPIITHLKYVMNSSYKSVMQKTACKNSI